MTGNRAPSWRPLAIVEGFIGRTGRYAGLAFALVWLVPAVVFLLLSPGFPNGGGVFPFALGALMFVLSLANGYRELRLLRQSTGDRADVAAVPRETLEPESESPPATSLLFAVIVVIMGALAGLGAFLIVLIGGTIISLKLVYKRTWLFSIVVGVVETVATIYIFQLLGAAVPLMS